MKSAYTIWAPISQCLNLKDQVNLYTLTKEQISRLYQFTSRYFLEYYDLQTELVDHLANGIAQARIENPALSFERALRLEFRKFGISGFHKVIENHRESMNRRYLNIILEYFKTYFKLPMFLMTLTFILIYISLLPSVLGQFLYYLVVATVWSVFLFRMSKTWFFRKKQVVKRKKWLLEELIFNQMRLFNSLLLPIQFLYFASFRTTKNFFSRCISLLGVFVYFLGILNFWLVPIQLLYFSSHQTMAIFFYQGVFSIAGVLYLLLVYIVTIQIPENASNLLKKTYPEYEML